MQRYCLTHELLDDPMLIARNYVRHHYPHGRRGKHSRHAIYHLGTRAFMIVDVSDDFRFERKAELDRNNLAVQEWRR